MRLQPFPLDGIVLSQNDDAIDRTEPGACSCFGLSAGLPPITREERAVKNGLARK